MKIVVTGFEPFDGLEANVSQDVLALLPSELGGVVLERAVLPVDSERVAGVLDALPADATHLLHLGLASDRVTVSFERVALNLLDFSRPDNGGHRPRDREIVRGAPLALPARWPHREVLAAWAGEGIEGAPSTSAGTYLCNQAFFLSLARRPEPVRVGFVHLPPPHALDLHRAARAVTLAIEAAL